MRTPSRVELSGFLQARIEIGASDRPTGHAPPPKHND